MMMSKSASKKLGMIAGGALALIIVGSMPTILELRTISTVMEQYRLDEAVHEQMISDSRKNTTVDEVLDPPFMHRYGLASRDYLDKDGYFSPKGTDWMKWKLETRTAALMMWAHEAFPTAWRVHQAIRWIDDYYNRNDKSTPVVQVVQAIAQR